MINCLSEGYGIIPKKVMRDQSITAHSKLVLAYMLSFTGAGKIECWPSVDTMATDLGINRCTVMKAVEGLISAGYVKKSRLYANDPLKKANKYTMEWLYGEVDQVDFRGRQGQLTGSAKATYGVEQADTNNNTLNNNNKRIRTTATPLVDLPFITLPHTFRHKWIEWCGYCRENRQPRATLVKHLEWCEKVGADTATIAIDKSILHGWRGIGYTDKKADKTTAAFKNSADYFAKELGR